MENKLSELSKPVAYTDADELRFNHATSDMWPIPLGFGKDAPLYSQEYVSALLAELEREIEMRAQNLEIKTLLAEKVKELETKLWDSQQLVDAKSSSQIELRSQISSLEESNRKDMAWRGERLCELEDSLEEVQKRIAELEADKRQLNEIINTEANRADAAEKRLATPVRLPEGLAQKIKVTGYYEALNEMMDCVRAAGFTVEGDE